jgi:hypothetical protein
VGDLGCLSEVIFNTTQNGFLIMQLIKNVNLLLRSALIKKDEQE